MHRLLIGAAIALGALVGLVAAGVGVALALSRAHDRARVAALQPFYDPPNPLPPGRPGDLIRAEALDAPDGVRAWRVLYHSTTFDGADVAVSGMVAVPDRPPPPSGFPIVGLAHGTVGSARVCAPSLSPFMSRSSLPSFLSPSKENATYYDLLIKPFVDAGYAVAATDYRGLGTPGVSPYLVGDDAARNILDSVRMIRLFPEVRVSDQILIWGQSQGGQSAAFVGQIAPRYAPELRLLGLVVGAPAAELGMLADEIERVEGRSLLTGLFVMIARAWSATYPNLQAADVLTPLGLRRMNVVDQKCIDGVLLAFGFRSVTTYVKPDSLRSPLWQAAITRNTPGATGTPAPIRLFQGGADPLIKPAFTDAFVQQLCAIGNTVSYQVYPGLGHINAIGPSMPDTLAWMAARLANEPPPNIC